MIMNLNRRSSQSHHGSKSAANWRKHAHSREIARTHSLTHLHQTHVYYDERKPRGDPTHVRLTRAIISRQ